MLKNESYHWQRIDLNLSDTLPYNRQSCFFILEHRVHSGYFSSDQTGQDFIIDSLSWPVQSARVAARFVTFWFPFPKYLETDIEYDRSRLRDRLTGEAIIELSDLKFLTNYNPR